MYQPLIIVVVVVVIIIIIIGCNLLNYKCC